MIEPGSFHPPRRTLMGPGPSDVYPRVLEALSRPTIGHLDPAFVGMMDEMKELLRYAFRTRNELTLPVSGARIGRHGDLFRQSGGAGRQGHGLPERRVRRAHEGKRRTLRRNAMIVEDAWGTAVDPQQAGGGAAPSPAGQPRGLRPCRDLHRGAFRCADPGGARAPAGLPHHRRCRHFARRVSAAESTNGSIDAGVFRDPEMPVVHPGPVAGEFRPPRPGSDQRAPDARAELVPGPQLGHGLLGRGRQAHAIITPRPSTRSMACTRRW